MLQPRKDRPRRKRSLWDAWPVLRRRQERGRDGCEGGIQLGAKALHHGNDGDEFLPRSDVFDCGCNGFVRTKLETGWQFTWADLPAR